MASTTIAVPNRVAGLFDDALREKLHALRWDLHEHPELAFQETRTAERLEKALEGFPELHAETLDPEWRPNVVLRGPASLPISVRPGAR